MSTNKIKIKFQFGTNDYADKRALTLALIIIYINYVMIRLQNLFQSFRESNSPSYIPNDTISNILLQCSIPYDKYRCSILSNKSDDSIKRITDVQAMTGHALPFVSYALQLYLIREFFSFTENDSYISMDIFPITALIVFIIIAIAVHGSSCFHFYTCMIICSTGICLSGFVFYQLVHNNHKYFSRTLQRQKLVTNNKDHETKISIFVLPSNCGNI